MTFTNGLRAAPVANQLEGLFAQWISLLRDYTEATGEWKQLITDDLWDLYQQAWSFSEYEGIEENPHYRLITSRGFDQHLTLIRARGPVVK